MTSLFRSAPRATACRAAVATTLFVLFAAASCTHPDEVLPCNATSPCADGYACVDATCAAQVGPVLDAETTCRAMCEHLVLVLSGCGSSDATSIPVCEGECAVHLAAEVSTLAEVSCGAGAIDCGAWVACGDLL